VAFPFDIAQTLRPAALADLTRKLATVASAKNPDTVGGTPVLTVTSYNWTAVVTADKSHRLLWLSGPVRAGALARPSVGGTDTGRLLPAYLRDPGPIPVAQPPYVSIAVAPAAPEPVRSAIATLRPQASPALPGASAAPQGKAPAQADVTPKFAAFELAINATNCSTPVCSWTVAVTNTGDAPGEATVYATATPGMPLMTRPLGMLAPGQTATTPPMSFGNPAPIPRPGQTTQVTVHYEAWVYSSTLLGPDPGVAQRLQGRGFDLSNDLPQVDAGYMPTVLGALDQMTRDAPTGTRNNAALAAVTDALNAGMLPDLKALVDSGRLENPQDLPDKLRQAGSTTATRGTDGDIGYRREIEQAAELVRQDPTAKIILDGYLTNPQTGEKEGADLLDVANKRAYQLKAVTSDKLRPAITEAIKQLNGQKGVDGRTGVRQKAPPGFGKVVMVFVEPDSVFHQKTRDEFVSFLRRSQGLGLCDGAGVPAVDRLIIVAAQGTFDWPKEQFGVFGSPCR
jgi:hypothetical protein